MLAIRDGFTTAAEPEPDDEWEDLWGDDEEDMPDDSDVTTTEVMTEPPTTTAGLVTDPPTSETETTAANGGTTESETTAGDTSATEPVTTDAPETETSLSDTSATEPSVTEPLVTDPPVTEPPVTDPPATEPPVVDPDRVNDPDYFKDALFIGDSRTVGLATYGRIDGATYFGRTAMSVGNAFSDKKSETEKSGLNLEQLLTQYRFGKIYILLGINEIGYSYNWITSRYEKVINKIRQLQPDAIIIIQSNMHVTKAKSDANPDTFNNARINELNRRLSAMADNKTVFYADLTSAFDDGTGAMHPDYTGDGVHLRAKYYSLWRDWLLEYGKR
ncbi:MAG: hypothetical protein IJD10_06435 [Clostridia bacterium]|nr:hypothetical protein [Clostridia bacterium]